MDEAPALGRVLFYPLTANEIVGLDFEKFLENQRKGLRGRLLERQHLDVIVVQPQKPSMAFEMGFAEVVVEEGVVLQPGVFDFDRREIQNLLQNKERFVFRKDAAFDEIAHLQQEALGLCPECGPRPFELAIEQQDLLVRRKKR